MGVRVTHVISAVELAKEARVTVAVVHTYLEQVHIILCFYLSALVPVLTYHFIKTQSRLYAEQPVTAAHIMMSNFKNKAPGLSGNV